jgi:hypothetical protein
VEGWVGPWRELMWGEMAHLSPIAWMSRLALSMIEARDQQERIPEREE